MYLIEYLRIYSINSLIEYHSINRIVCSALVLRDSGANMVKGMKLSKVDDLSCFAHALQLVINDAIGSQQMVKQVLTKFRNIATHFRHSVLAKQRLSTIQKSLEMEQHSILQSVPTRWNSNLVMLERILEQKRALVLYASEHGHIPIPNSNEWDIAEKLVATLKPFEIITKDIGKADASISVIIPNVNVLKMLLESTGSESLGIQTLRSGMLNSLNRRFKSINQCKPVVIACILDPRYKDRPFDSSTKDRGKQWLEDSIDGLVVNSDVAAISGSPPVTGQATSYDEMFDTLLSRHEPSAAGGASEVERYLMEPVIDRKSTSPLVWWHQNEGRFPALAKAARKFLSPPPTTLPSERVFSTIGLIYDDHRSSLLGANAEKLCFLNYNLKCLNWKY